MNTLDKVADLESKISILEAKLSVFEVLAIGMPKLIQESQNFALDISSLSKAINDVVNTINKRTSDLGQMDNMIITRLMGLEQSYASITKTIAATISELTNSKVLNQAAVMNRLRLSDESSEKERVSQLLQMKVIQEVDESAPNSLLVVSQVFKFNQPSDEPDDLVADYRTVDLSSSELTEETRLNYVNKKIGDVVSLDCGDGILYTTIITIYNHVKAQVQGETELSL